MTQVGPNVLGGDPESPGSLGIAISEAVEEAASRADTNYSLGSVLNHVLLHQTRDRARSQKPAREGGRVSRRRLRVHAAAARTSAASRFRSSPTRRRAGSVRLVAVEPTSCPTLTRGHYAYDFGDTAGSRRSCSCTRSATTSCRRGSMPGACAITATRRSSHSSCTKASSRPGPCRSSPRSRPA